MSGAFSLQANRIQIWELDLDADWQHGTRLLSLDERARAGRFSRIEFARRFCAGRSALRLLLSQLCGVAPDKIVLGLAEHGKPILVFPPIAGLCFNVSHTDRHALIAFSSHPVGIDIETVTHGPGIGSLAEIVCHPQELDWLNTLLPGDRTHQIHRLWVRKEAYLKATGLGLHMAPNRIRFERGVLAQAMKVVDSMAESTGSWWVVDLDSQPRACLASVCFRSEGQLESLPLVERRPFRPA